MPLRPFVCANLVAFALTRAFAGDVAFQVTDGKQPVADAVVVLYPLDTPMPRLEPGAPVEIEQKDIEFHPFVTVLPVGGTTILPNREARVSHHVFSASKAKPFEFPLYKPGKAESVVFDKPGVVVLGCDIHDFMLAYVAVVDSAWFAKTPASGGAAFNHLPAGRWRAEIWHPRLKDAADKGFEVASRIEFAVPPEGNAPTQTVALKLEANRRVRRGPNVGGAGYK